MYDTCQCEYARCTVGLSGGVERQKRQSVLQKQCHDAPQPRLWCVDTERLTRHITSRVAGVISKKGASEN